MTPALLTAIGAVITAVATLLTVIRHMRNHNKP